MPSVSKIYKSPIAKYLILNNAKTIRNKYKYNYVQFVNSEGKLIGELKREHDIDFSKIDISLFKPGEEEPFLHKMTIINKTVRYFLEKHRFMPVKIELKHSVYDYEHNIKQGDVLTKGLASNLYIDKIEESNELVNERNLQNLPEDFPIYKINKPFKYDFKAHLYNQDKPIDSSKPMIKEY